MASYAGNAPINKVASGKGRRLKDHRRSFRFRNGVTASSRQARTLARLKGYVTNLAACLDGTPITADFTIGSYHRLFEIEQAPHEVKQRHSQQVTS